MSSWMSRQQRRQKMRQMAKAPNIEAAMEKLDKNSQEFEERAIRKIKDELEPEIFRQAQGASIMLMLSVLKLRYKHRGDWLKKFLKEFVEFSDQMQWDGVTVQDLIDMLKDNTGVDFLKEIRKLEETEAERRAERRINMRRIRKEGIV